MKQVKALASVALLALLSACESSSPTCPPMTDREILRRFVPQIMPKPYERAAKANIDLHGCCSVERVSSSLALKLIRSPEHWARYKVGSMIEYTNERGQRVAQRQQDILTSCLYPLETLATTDTVRDNKR